MRGADGDCPEEWAGANGGPHIPVFGANSKDQADHRVGRYRGDSLYQLAASEPWALSKRHERGVGPGAA